MALKKLCPRVYWHRGQWQYQPARALRPSWKQLNLSERWIPLGDDDAQAYKRFGKLLQQLNSPTRKTGMMAIFDYYENFIVPTKGKRTQEDKLGHLKRLRVAFGHLEPSQVTTAGCQRYCDKRGKSSPHQANQEISTLSQSFRHAKARGLFNGENPVTGIIRHVIRNRERLPDQEVDLNVFKQHASIFCAAWVDFKLETGLRQGDILSLELNKHILDDGIHLTLNKSRGKKTTKRVFIPWSEALLDAKNRLMSTNKKQGAFMVCNLDGKQLTAGGFAQRWQSSMKKALSAKNNPLKEKFTEHDIAGSM